MVVVVVVGGVEETDGGRETKVRMKVELCLIVLTSI